MERKFTFSKITKKFGYFFLRRKISGSAFSTEGRFSLSWCRLCWWNYCLRCRHWLVYISRWRNEGRLNTIRGGWLFDYLKRRNINYWLVCWRWYQNNLTLTRIFILIDLSVVQLHNRPLIPDPWFVWKLIPEGPCCKKVGVNPVL